MDHYLATIQTILDRCDDNNTSLSIDDIEVIKTNLCRIIKGLKVFVTIITTILIY